MNVKTLRCNHFQVFTFQFQRDIFNLEVAVVELSCLLVSSGLCQVTWSPEMIIGRGFAMYKSNL